MALVRTTGRRAAETTPTLYKRTSDIVAMPREERTSKKRRLNLTTPVSHSVSGLGLATFGAATLPVGRPTSGAMAPVGSVLVKSEPYLTTKKNAALRQDTHLRRQEKSRASALQAPRRGQLNVLEANAVRISTASDYQQRLDVFEAWTARQRLQVDYDNPAKLCDVLLEYFDMMCFEELKGSGEGSKVLAAIAHFHPVYAGGLRRGGLARLERALRGWEKVIPPGSIVALPEMVVYGIANEMCRTGRFSLALRTILSMDAYLRPGVTSALRKENMVPPQPSLGAGGVFWSLHLHRREDGLTSKVGVFDDSVILDSPDRQWMNALLAERYRKVSATDLIFPEPMSEWGRYFKEALVRMGLPPTVLYALRHSGPSIDILNKARDLQAVKRRGCWAADSSVRRYEKAAKTMSLSKDFSGELKTYLLKCKKQLPQIMMRFQVPVEFGGACRNRTRG